MFSAHMLRVSDSKNTKTQKQVFINRWEINGSSVCVQRECSHQHNVSVCLCPAIVNIVILGVCV